MTPIEAIAVVFGLACVVLTIRQHIACWPTGLVMVVLYIWIFYQARLFSDMALQIIYIFMQIYGWVHWSRGGPRENPLPIVRLSAREKGIWAAVAIMGTVALGFGMNRWAGAALPYWDAFAAVLSLIAQWFLARKILESWLLWITVDIVSIGIYSVKDLYLTAGLYVVFLGLAITGLVTWKKEVARV